MTALTKDINGETIQIELSESVVNFIKMVAILEQKDNNKLVYKINNIEYTFPRL